MIYLRWLAAAIVFFVGASTAYLAWLNWNDQLARTTFSLIVGVAAAIVTAALSGAELDTKKLRSLILPLVVGGVVSLGMSVFELLREDSISGQFRVELTMDATTGLTPFPAMSAGPTAFGKRFMWEMSVHNIGMQSLVKDLKVGESLQVPVPRHPTPLTAGVVARRCAQLVEYKILEDIRDSQSSSKAKSPVVNGERIPSFFAPFTPADVSDAPPDDVRSLLTENPFHSNPGGIWQLRTLRLPPGSRVASRHIPSSPESGPEKQLLTIERPNYFRGVLVIESLGVSSSGNSTLRHVGVAVTTKVTFYRFRAGSTESQEAKRWFQWLITMLADRNAGGTGQAFD